MKNISINMQGPIQGISHSRSSLAKDLQYTHTHRHWFVQLPRIVGAFWFGTLMLAFALLQAQADVGDDFKDKDEGFMYHVLTETGSSGTVSVSSIDDMIRGDIRIPETFTKKSVTYTVTEIKSTGFKTCTGLTSVVLPPSVTAIGYSAFDSCLKLASVTIEAGGEDITIGESAFAYCKELTSIELNGVTTIGKEAFYECSKLTSIEIPNGMATIGNGAFWKCGLTSIIIPNSVTKVGDRSFLDCRSLTSVTLPNSLTLIGLDTFCGCRSLSSIEIPNSVTLIESSAFEECGLTSIIIPNSVTTIGNNVFRGCENLTSITVPARENIINTINTEFASHDNKPTIYISPVITEVPTASAITYGKSLSDSLLTGGTASKIKLDGTNENVEGVFNWANPATQPPVGTESYEVIFTPTDTANYTDSTATVLLQVDKAKPVVTWTTPAPIKLGIALSKAQLNAMADVRGMFTYTPAIGTKLPKGTHILKATFIPEDSMNYEQVEVTMQLIVEEEEIEKPTLTWRIKEGKLHLTFTGTLEFSEDLLDWSPVTGAKDTFGETPTGGKKFFRIVK